MFCNKYRLFPGKAQETVLNETLAVCRLVYNSLVHERTALHEQGHKSPTYYTQAPAITRWKKDHAELKTVHSQVLQNVAIRVEFAFQAFFRRVKQGGTPGYPRLKGKGQYDSITYPGTGFKVGDSPVTLSLLGRREQIKAKLHRPFVGKVKTCTVRKYGKKWFVCFSVEQEDSPLLPSAECVGLDAGLNSFLSLSNGEFVDNPRFFRRDEKALAKAGRKQAKTKKRSRERRKANKILSRIHERIRNRRHDFVHQTARRLINRFDVIAVEKLNVKGMVKNHHLAKSISDASWSMFREVLAQKAESAGRDANGTVLREVIAVNPAYTSQDCSGCGYRPDGLEGRTKKKLSDRWHFCPNCSASLDRDTNAAINILALALSTKPQNHKQNHTGITVCQVTPVEAPAFTQGSSHQFATVHPYYDGNGRTARLLTTLILHRTGYGLKGIYSLEEYYARNLTGYYEALSVGHSHHYYFGRADAEVTGVAYFCAGMAEAFAAVRVQAAAAARRGGLDDSLRLRRLDPRQRLLLDLFRRQGTATAAEMARHLGLSPRTVAALCRGWLADGFLSLRDLSRKSRSYHLGTDYERLAADGAG